MLTTLLPSDLGEKAQEIMGCEKNKVYIAFEKQSEFNFLAFFVRLTRSELLVWKMRLVSQVDAFIFFLMGGKGDQTVDMSWKMSSWFRLFLLHVPISL